MIYEELRKKLQDGKTPLLTRPQLLFSGQVNTALEREIKNHVSRYRHDPGDVDRTSEVMSPLSSALKENLDIAVELLSSGRQAKFDETYPKFIENRKECISKLEDLAVSMNTDRYNCNVSKLFGYVISAVGGAITLASAITIPLTMGLSTPLAVAGGSMTAVGYSTVIGTSITETARLQNKVATAKMLIEEDRKYVGIMNDSLNCESDIKEAFSKILNVDTLKAITKKIKEFVDKAIEIENDDKRLKFVEKSITALIKTFQPNSTKNDMVPILAIASIITVLVISFLLLLNTESRLVFDCASLTIKSTLGIASLVDSSMNVIRLSSLFGRNAAVAKNIAKAVTRGTVGSVIIALDVAGIVFTSMDVHKGSHSPEAKKVMDALINMREETDVLEKEYESLSQMQN